MSQEEPKNPIAGYEPQRLTNRLLGEWLTGKHAANPAGAYLMAQEVLALREQLRFHKAIKDDNDKEIAKMRDMLIVKHNCLSSVYGSIEHEDDEFLQKLTMITVTGLNAGTKNGYDTFDLESLPVHLKFVPGLD